MDHVRTVWSDLRPDTPFQASFVSDLVAATGLASLVAYLTRLRRKEIGVRKALGGSATSIVTLLNKEYAQIVGAAFLVGAPLAWWAADAWLSQFANQVGISPLVFIGTGLGALVVAITAVSTEAVRAARVDPATVLQSE